MNELQRLKQLQQSIVNPAVEIPQLRSMEQNLLRMLGDMQLPDWRNVNRKGTCGLFAKWESTTARVLTRSAMKSCASTFCT